MATVTRTKQSDGVVNFCHGSFTSDGAAQLVNLGFNPNYVYVINETDVITWEKIQPQVAANCLKVVGSTGVMTLDAGSQILLNGDGTITLGATLVGTAKAIKFRATL
jgi:hypothetical protein